MAASASETPMLDRLDARAIASLCIGTADTSGAAYAEQVRQTQERIDVIRCWFAASPAPAAEAAAPGGPDGDGKEHDDDGDDDGDDDDYGLSEAALADGAAVVELGCGQGDATAVIAALLREAGRGGKVYGVDPGAPDYGSPYTLAQAQGHLARGPLGNWTEFQQGDARVLETLPAAVCVDTLVLLHSLWYFPDRAAVSAMAAAARARGVRHVCVAEWDITSRGTSASTSDNTCTAAAHHAAVDVQRQWPLPGGNIRTVLTPTETVALVQAAGYRLVRQRTLASPLVADAAWEVATARAHLGTLHARALARARVRKPCMAADNSEGDNDDSNDDDDDDGNRGDGDDGHCDYDGAHVFAAALNALTALTPPRGERVPTLDVWTGVFALRNSP